MWWLWFFAGFICGFACLVVLSAIYVSDDVGILEEAQPEEMPEFDINLF